MTRPPITSIIILTLNQLDYTRQCVESVVRNTPEPHELIFVDNASTDGTVDYLRTVAGSKLITNAENRGFAAGNNQGLAIADGETVVLLNNDTLVTPGWLGGMLAVLDRYPRVGVVGPRSNYVAGTQQIDHIPYTDPTGLEAFARERTVAFAQQGRAVGSVVGFCLMARRAVVDQIGGLDPSFGSGNFEDNDFCVRALLAGWLCWMADDVFVHHYGHRTFIGEGIDWTQSMQRNGALFARKWGLPPAVDGVSIPIGDILSRRSFDQTHDNCPLPENTAYTHVTPSLALYYRGVQLLAGGSPAAAIPVLLEAVAAEPSVADFRNALGAGFAEAGQWTAALRELTAAYNLAPGRSDILANLEEARVAAGPTPLDSAASMRADWDARADADAFYYVHSTKFGQSETEFDSSGYENVRQLVKPELSRIQFAPGSHQSRALEIGCGAGRMTRHIAALFDEVYGVDISPKMIAIAAERLRDVPNAHVQANSGRDLADFASSSFDFCFSFIVLMHIPDREAIRNYVREASRVTRPGGIIKLQLQGYQAADFRDLPKNTWQGETFAQAEMLALTHELGLDVVESTGAGTQNFWLILRVPMARTTSQVAA
jgi:GT2 family glycosyltransferase/SAM-dependent methyltransferase